MDLFKNGVGRPSNETIKKRNIFKGICVLLVLVIIGLVGYILNDKGIINLNNNKTSGGNDDAVTTTKAAVEENKSVEEVQKLFLKLNGLNGTLDFLSKDGNVDYWSYFYAQEKLVNEDVLDKMKIAIALQEYFKEEFSFDIQEYKKGDYDFNKRNKIEQQIYDSKVNVSDINKIVLRIFGNEIKDFNVDGEVLGFSILYNKSLNVYTFEAAGIGDAGGAKTISKIIDTKVLNNKIEIYNKIAFIAGGMDTDTKVFKDVEKDDFNFLKNKYGDNMYNNGRFYYGGINELVSYPNESTPSDSDILDKYFKQLNTYKWTFTKASNDNYVFTSVEKIK